MKFWSAVLIVAFIAALLGVIIFGFNGFTLFMCGLGFAAAALIYQEMD